MVEAGGPRVARCADRAVGRMGAAEEPQDVFDAGVSGFGVSSSGAQVVTVPDVNRASWAVIGLRPMRRPPPAM